MIECFEEKWWHWRLLAKGAWSGVASRGIDFRFIFHCMHSKVQIALGPPDVQRLISSICTRRVSLTTTISPSWARA